MAEMWDQSVLLDVRMGNTPPETLHRACLTICANAESTDEAIELMKMVGLYA